MSALGQILSRWSSDFNTPPPYDGYFVPYGNQNYNSGGGAVGYEIPSSFGLYVPPPFIPVQVPNPAINDLDVETVGVQFGVNLLSSVSSGTGYGQTPGPGAIESASATIYRNYIPFLTVPLTFSTWGTAIVNNTYYASNYVFQGTLTPQTAFPLYQSDLFSASYTFALEQPVPQSGGLTPPATSLQVRPITIGWCNAFNGTFAPLSGICKFSFIGNVQSKGSLF